MSLAFRLISQVKGKGSPLVMKLINPIGKASLSYWHSWVSVKCPKRLTCPFYSIEHHFPTLKVY